MEKIFVYGSLRKGGWAHDRIEHCPLVGQATLPGATLYSVGKFPALVLTQNGTTVVGELYEADEETVEMLDWFEGVPRMYQRVQLDVSCHGQLMQAWVYVWQYETDDLPLVKSGDWMRR